MNPDEGLFLLMTYIFVLALIALSMMLHKQELQTSVMNRDLWRHRAGIDELTGLSNRYIFMPILEAELGRTRRHKRPFSLALLDLDHFKAINDSRGHLFGDKVLKSIAHFMQTKMRTIDVLCRFGGEETQESLLKRADRLLYAAKHGGRNLLMSESPDQAPDSSQVAG